MSNKPPIILILFVFLLHNFLVPLPLSTILPFQVKALSPSNKTKTIRAFLPVFESLSAAHPFPAPQAASAVNSI